VGLMLIVVDDERLTYQTVATPYFRLVKTIHDKSVIKYNIDSLL
jgi:hypothetical protein